MTNVFSEPIPLRDPIASPERPEFRRRRSRGEPEARDPLEGLITRAWQDWFTNLLRIIGATPRSIFPVSLSAQGASIAATDIAGGTLSAGVYRLSWYLTVTRAATTSSSIEVDFDFQDGSVTKAHSPAALTGNATSEWQSGSLLIRVDGAPVRYSTTYASVGATSMQYSLEIRLEQVGG